MRKFFARISRRTWIIVAVVAVLLLAGGGGALVYAQANGLFASSNGAYTPPSTTSSTGNSRRATGGKHHAQNGTGNGGGGMLQRLLAEGISGSVKVKDASAPGGYAIIAFAKGALTNVDAASGQIAIQEPDGTTASYTVPSTARIQAGGAKGALANLQPGQAVAVITQQQQGGTPVVIAVIAQAAPGSSSGASATPTVGGL